MATMTPVQSSLLVAVGFDDATQELVIQFPRGATYAYKNPEDPSAARIHFDKLLHPDTESVGKYFLGHIKTNTDLKFRRLGDVEPQAPTPAKTEKPAKAGLQEPEPLKQLF